MKTTRYLAAATLLAVTSAIAVAQPFEQKGPTGDNRAATGNPGTQQPFTGNGKEAVKQKRPSNKDHEGKSKQSANPNAAAPTASPGTPAENNAQPASAK